MALRPPKLLDRVREANRRAPVPLPMRPEHLPVVLTRDEVRAVILERHGTPRLMATLLYGRGRRLLECCRLRVQDVDFATNQIIVRDAKGAKDRVTLARRRAASEILRLRPPSHDRAPLRASQRDP